MVLLFVAFFSVYCLFNVHKKGTRLLYFISTIIVSVFLFASTDPFIGIPLYFWMLLTSIFLSVISYGFPRIDAKLVTIVFAFFVLFIIQVIKLKTGSGITKGLILNKSDTDSMILDSELYLPVLNFTVLKHFVFFAVYILFVIFNADLIRDRINISLLIKFIIRIFRILFVCIVLEFLVINLLGGFNDRFIMEFVFNFKSNQTANWSIFDDKLFTVAFCFNEPSYMGIVVIYYFLRMFDNGAKKLFAWDILAVLACACTWSSTAILMSSFFIIILFLRTIFSKKTNFCLKAISVLGIVSMFVVVLLFNNIIFNKFFQFIGGDTNWGSAYFRRQSIDYALTNIAHSPLFGSGIGTIYCHSCLVQTVANIGIMGFVLSIYFHVHVMPKSTEPRFFILFKTCTLLLYSLGFSMVQHFTSPILLASIISVMFSENFLRDKKIVHNFKNSMINKYNSSGLPLMN